MRLRSWTHANRVVRGRKRVFDRPLLITEYGCAERDEAHEAWDFYGKRVSAFTHFGSWSALVLGHAGVPFKWNDAKEHGEMASRTSAGRPSAVWSKTKYPVNNYGRIHAVHEFVKSLEMMHVPLDVLEETLELDVVKSVRGREEKDLLVDKSTFKTTRFNAWALANKARTVIVVWVYDRTFASAGKNLSQQLKIRVNQPNLAYDVWRYNTWDGLFEQPEKKAVKSDQRRELRVPLKRFLRAELDKTVKGVADGNDMAFVIVAT
jgi:hypothetical protein